MNYLKIIGKVRKGTCTKADTILAINLIKKIACGLYDANFDRATYKTYEVIMTAAEVAEELVGNA